MSRGSRVGVSVGVVSAVALSGLLLLAVAPGMWWLLTIYGWVVFPALGLLGGTSGLSERKRVSGVAPVISNERRLLDALGRERELTAVKAAILTTLSVEESEKMLRELAEAGHLQIRVREGGIFYSIWGTDEDSRKEIETR